MDNNPTNADLDMIEALLASMHQNPAQLYEDVDDDDDDDDDDDYDDDEDDDGYYGEHNIHTLLNPYGAGGDGGDMPGADGQMNIPNVQTMNFIQGLLNMNNSSLPGMADIEAAMGGAIGGMGNPMDGGSAAAAAAAGFLPAMQSLLPNMGTDMAGALAGAFAGGMGSLMDYGHGVAQNGNEYDDDDEEDDDDEDEDEEALSDEEEDIDDEEDDDDDDDDDHHHQKHIRPLDPSVLALGGVGGLMAASLLANSSNLVNSSSSRSYSDNFQPPALLPPPHSLHTTSSTPSLPPCVSSQQSSVPAIGFCVPTPISMAPLPVSSTITSQPAIASTNVGSMSGGTVSRADPLAALVAGVSAAAIGAGAIAPIVNNLLGNSGGTTLVNNKLNASNPSSTTVIGNNDSLNTSSKTLHGTDNVDAVAASLALAKISSSQSPTQTTPSTIPSVISSSAPLLKTSSPESQTKLDTTPKEAKLSKEECDDDKASLGSASSSGSTTSGGGKSDTESFGKKTPSPVPEGTESTNSQEVGSYSSIPDLASTTESMRDSDDNHSEVHNVTANLSDLDNDVPEQQKPVPVSQYPVGALPVVVEHPTYGWSSMLGLDRAKEALKELFIARSFPPVFDGTEGSAKGILLFGPVGSGKTCLARALAKEANNALFVGISSRYLLTHNSFDAIKLVRCMFDQARHEKPAVILFDEIEALCYHPNNESAIRAKDEILAQVRGLTTLPPFYPPRQDPSTYNDGILVLGTTNQPWLLEDRLRRVFAYNIHVKLPGEKPRHELFRMFLQNLPHDINEEEFQCLVSKSEGYSAADINAVIRQASHSVSLNSHNDPGRGHRVLTFDDLATIMTQYRCRYNEDLQQKYSAYISAATHRAEDVEDSSKDKKDKPKGVKKFSHRIAKSLAAAVLSVID